MEEEIIIPEEPIDIKMRYILNSEGYICNISFGAEISCDLGNCTEYKGDIPEGYSTLEEWHDEEIERLNAWKIVDGNLVLDNVKNNELQNEYKQQEIDNACVRYKDLFGVQQQIDSQYIKGIATGKNISIKQVKQGIPRIKITDINTLLFDNIDLFVTSKNMLKNEATSQTINGVEFTQNEDRSITINGTATAEIEYNIAGTSNNTSPFLVLKKSLDYYLTSNDFTLKMYNYDGTDRTEIYTGSDGIINFGDEDKKVTQIVLSIPSGTTIKNVTIYPQLEYGLNQTEYEMYKSKSININFSDYIENVCVYPSSNLYPSSNSYPSVKTVIDYILIENGKIYISKDGNEDIIDVGYIELFGNNNTIFAIQDVNIEIEYTVNVVNVEFYNSLMRINMSGLHFYESNGTEIGDIGLIEDTETDLKQIAFSINGKEGMNKMVWGVKYNSQFIPVFSYGGNNQEEGTEIGGQFFFEAPIFLLMNALFLGLSENGPCIEGIELGNFNSVNFNNTNQITISDNDGENILTLSKEGLTLGDLLNTYYSSDYGCYMFDLNNNFLYAGNLAHSIDVDYFSSTGDYLYVSLRNSEEGFFLYPSSSDKELKENIEDSKSKALDIIKKIKHKQFNWKKNKKHVDIGYIAQELEEIDVNLINKTEITDKNGTKKTDYQVNVLQVASLCTKAIQEQQEIIENQQKQIDFLINKLNCKEELENYMKGE